MRTVLTVTAVLVAAVALGWLMASQMDGRDCSVVGKVLVCREAK